VASERDKQYLAHLGELKAQTHASAAAAHRALPLDERLARSMALMRRFLPTVRAVPDDPSRFYEIARRLGHYRP
jgi:hypothetical protein